MVNYFLCGVSCLLFSDGKYFVYFIVNFSMVLDTIGISSNNLTMEVNKLFHAKEMFKNGFVEVLTWQVPESVPPSEHLFKLFKYSLVYIVNGERIIGYDNERGKGDHKHILQEQLAYEFIDSGQLIKDFYSDVEDI